MTTNKDGIFIVVLYNFLKGFYPLINGSTSGNINKWKSTVKNQSFDSNKVSVIKNSAKTANFNSAQVRELLELMSFDSYKLEVAKYCYDFVVDKANFFKTYDVFQFESNVKELSNYVAGRN